MEFFTCSVRCQFRRHRTRALGVVPKTKKGKKTVPSKKLGMPAQSRKKNRAIEKDLLALFPNGPRSVRDRDAGSRPIATLPSRRRDARTRPRGRDRRENAKTRKARESRGRFAFHSRTRGDAYLDLLRHEFDLVLGVRHAHEVAVRHEVERVARRAHLLVHLVPAADARVVVRVEHALVRPRVLRAVQAVFRLVRERHARDAQQREAAEPHRGEPLAGRPVRAGRLGAGGRGARRGRGGRARRARQLVSEAEHRPCVAHVDNATARGRDHPVSSSSSSRDSTGDLRLAPPEFFFPAVRRRWRKMFVWKQFVLRSLSAPRAAGNPNRARVRRPASSFSTPTTCFSKHHVRVRERVRAYRTRVRRPLGERED